MTRKVFVLSILVGLGLFAAATAASAANITSVAVTAAPATYTGPCPVKITFTANIAVDGPGRVRYKWLRSDGAIDTAVHPPLSFPPGGGTRTATTTWTLGAAVPMFQPFSGWQKIELALGNTKKISDPANFTINCQQGNPTGGQRLPDLIPLLHQPMNGFVAVKNIGGAPAGPSRLLIKCDKLGTPGGGGCAPLPATLAPPFFSTPAGLVLDVPNLAPGAVFAPPVTFWAALVWSPGEYKFTATADFTNLVAESNELNNVTTSIMKR